MNRSLLFSILYVSAAALTTLLFHSWVSSEHHETIAYSDFKRLARGGRIVYAEIGDQAITGTLDLTDAQVIVTDQHDASRTVSGPGQRPFTTFRLEDPSLLADLAAGGARYGAVRRSHWIDEALSYLIPLLAFFGIWYYALRLLDGRRR